MNVSVIKGQPNTVGLSFLETVKSTWWKRELVVTVIALASTRLEP